MNDDKLGVTISTYKWHEYLFVRIFGKKWRKGVYTYKGNIYLSDDIVFEEVRADVEEEE